MSDDNIRNELKKRSLPTKVVLRDIDQEQLNQMSNHELLRVLNGEQAKAMLLQRQLRTANNDFDRVMRKIMGEQEELRDEKRRIEAMEQTPSNLKEYRKLMNRAKRLAERSTRVRNRTTERVQELTNKLESIEDNIRKVERAQIMNMGIRI